MKKKIISYNSLRGIRKQLVQRKERYKKINANKENISHRRRQVSSSNSKRGVQKILSRRNSEHKKLIAEEIDRLKRQVTLCTYINKKCLSKYSSSIARPGFRMVSPLRQGATNPSSFAISRDGQYFYDFGNPDTETNHGDIISFIMQHEKCGFMKALQILRNLAKELNDGR